MVGVGFRLGSGSKLSLESAIDLTNRSGKTLLNGIHPHGFGMMDITGQCEMSNVTQSNSQFSAPLKK